MYGSGLRGRKREKGRPWAFLLLPSPYLLFFLLGDHSLTSWIYVNLPPLFFKDKLVFIVLMKILLYYVFGVLCCMSVCAMCVGYRTTCGSWFSLLCGPWELTSVLRLVSKCLYLQNLIAASLCFHSFGTLRWNGKEDMICH